MKDAATKFVFISISFLRLPTAQVFPGQLQIQRPFSEEMNNKNSLLFIETAKNITDGVGDHLQDCPALRKSILDHPEQMDDDEVLHACFLSCSSKPYSTTLQVT